MILFDLLNLVKISFNYFLYQKISYIFHVIEEK
jgi:hypothetical protein